MAKRDLADTVEEIDEEVEALAKRLKSFEEFEERIDRTVEAKVFEIKALSYVILIIVSVLLAFVIGVSVKLFLG